MIWLTADTPCGYSWFDNRTLAEICKTEGITEENFLDWAVFELENTDFNVSYYPSSTIYGPTIYPYGVSGITNEKFLYNTLNDGKKQDAVYEWEIIENSVDVMVKNDLYTSNTIEIATLSTAINPTITLNLTYTE